MQTLSPRLLTGNKPGPSQGSRSTHNAASRLASRPLEARPAGEHAGHGFESGPPTVRPRDTRVTAHAGLLNATGDRGYGDR